MKSKHLLIIVNMILTHLEETWRSVRLDSDSDVSLFTPGHLDTHVVDNPHVITRSNLAHGAGLHPLAHLLKCSQEQRGLGLTISLLDHQVRPLLPVVDYLLIERFPRTNTVSQTLEVPLLQILLNHGPVESGWSTHD